MKKLSISVLSVFQTQQVANKLEHLDGFRGMAALIVVFHHFTGVIKTESKDYRIFVGMGSYVAVTGFFILSAFLLTYRLMIDFERAQNYRISMLKIIHYVLRRFFRIYVVYALFLIIHFNFPRHIPLGGRPSIKYIDAIMLSGKIGTHLWTIPPEIKYYFCIPVISLCAFQCGKHWYLFALSFLPIIGILENAYPEPGLIPGIRCVNIFLKGSLLGILYYNLKRNETAMKFIGRHYIQAIITPILVVITIIQFKYFNYLFNPKINLTLRNIGSSVMFFEVGLLLISEQPNPFTKFFNSQFLKSCGKFSFGIYLFHNMVLHVFNYKKRIFAANIDLIVSVLIASYIIGFLWFYLVENPLMKIANRLCKKFEQLQFFRLSNEMAQTP